MIWGGICVMRELEWNNVIDDGMITGADVCMPAFNPQEDILNIRRDILYIS